MGALPWPPSQQQPDSQSPQETDLQQPTPTGGGSGFLQPQRTGPQGPAGVNQQQQQSGGVPPVPPITQNSQSQFQQQRPQLQLPRPQFGQNGSVSGVSAQQRFLSPSPGLGGQLTLTAQHTALNGSGIGGIRPLVSQPTRFNDPRMQMMSSTFMPTSIQAPSGAPQSSGGPPSSQSLQQPSQQHNQAQRGTSTSKAPWVLSKEERKDYDQIFYTWDLSNSGFIDRGTATEVFSQSGLDRNALAQIWVLADAENRGKLNIQEFHVAMGLIYRRLNGNEIPPILPLEMEPVSSKHLSESVDSLKDLLKNDTNVRATAIESRGKVYSFGDSPTPKTNPRKDGTIYKHDDTNVRGYTSSSRRVDRSAIRSGETTPSDDLSDIKQQLQNTNERFDKIRADAEGRTAEDEALNNELDDLKYRVRRVQEDLDHVSRGPKSAAKDQERRKLERELLYLMHEKVPEVEKQIEERDRRKQREEEWVRDRDRKNDRNRSEHDSSSRRRSRERSDFSSDDEVDKGYLRGTYDRKDNYHSSYRQNGSRDRDRDQDYRRDGRDRSRGRDWGRGYDRDRDYDRRASPALVHSPASPSPTTSSTVNEVRKSAAAPASTAALPAPPTKNMTAEERVYYRRQAQQRLQDRMKALGLGGPAPSSSLPVDTSVEDRLERERKEAEGKALQAERDAEERERARKEHLGALRPSPLKKLALYVPAAQKPPPPPPRPKVAPSAILKPAPPAAVPQPVPRASKIVVPVEEKRRREEIAKRRVARLAELRRLEEEARREEVEYQKRINASQRGRMTSSSSPLPASISGRTPSVPVALPRSVALPLSPPPPVPSSVPSPNAQKPSPFHRLMEGGSSGLPSSSIPTRLPIVPPPVPLAPPLPASSLVPVTVPLPLPPAVASLALAHQERTPQPASQHSYPAVGNSYKPSAADDRGESDSDSSDEETLRRMDRAEIFNTLFGGIVRPKSATAGSPTSDTPPQPSQAPTVPDVAFRKSEEPADRRALMNAITSGVPKLRKTVTNDKSGVAIAGSVIGGDVNSLTHITNPLRVPSSEVPSIVHGGGEHNGFETLTHTKSESRQSVDWYADLTANNTRSSWSATTETGPAKVTDDLMADIEIDTTLSVRSLYPYDGQRAEDLSFSENVVISAHPSKSGGDWWHGTLVSNGKRGFFPASYVVVIGQVTHARALYTYYSSSADELSFNEDDTLSIVERSEGDWWKAQKDGSVFLVPAAYLEMVNVLSPSLGVPVDNTEPVTTPIPPPVGYFHKQRSAFSRQHFKAGSRATTALSTDRKSTLAISAPVIYAPMADAGTSIQQSNTPAFESSWSRLASSNLLPQTFTAPILFGLLSACSAPTATAASPPSVSQLHDRLL
ncbi:uncharacterized protein EI90DRAFT_3125615 [Cantharellus anzutake]|uniref:uncharacterized protein n=1 Tax=Cantharellus anzutake TaxID=1750568 RepID=UPI00190658B6|nr:uncharacterized protein EI90DRAFT_3125615 [Cantharellus anzutake]KAF8328868.1 hypothetical protein EI90DRAFT_3125615 [Cantharellus anzutake]